MTRAIAFLVGDWPLKLAALGLAAVLYGGLVLSESTRTWLGQVPIAVVDPPPGGVLLVPPGSVTSIRYRAPLDVAGELTADTFRATIDLSGVTPQAGGPPVAVPVRLVSNDRRVSVVDHTPSTVEIRLDSIVNRTVPITVERGVAPEGLVLGPPQVEPAAVLLRGASSTIANARSVVARVAVDGSGLNIDQVVDLEVVDEAGDQVLGVELEPGEARVRIDVARELAYAVLPVTVELTGTPAHGHRVGEVRVEPTTVTVSGEAPAVERMVSISTAPVPVAGLATDRSRTVALVLPPEISILGEPQATVHVGIVPVRASRVMETGLVLTGVRRDRHTTLSTDAVLVTVRGEVAALDALEAGTTGMLIGEVDVTGLGNGRHEVAVEAAAPDGIEVISVAPGTVTVRIGPSAPAATATPAPDPSVAPDAARPGVSPVPATSSSIGSTASVPPSGGVVTPPASTRPTDIESITSAGGA